MKKLLDLVDLTLNVLYTSVYATTKYRIYEVECGRRVQQQEQEQGFTLVEVGDSKTESRYVGRRCA